MTENSLSRQPIYNIRSVTERTGIAPETLRAWERRYGFPDPYRNPKGYRLYTEDEIATLNWLRKQTESGMNIGQAIKLLNELKAIGQDPARSTPYAKVAAEPDFLSVDQILESLLADLLSLDENGSHNILKAALEYHPIETVMLEIIAPTMTRIGDFWHNGEIPIAVEHFATQICRNHLVQILEGTFEQETKGTIITACAPGEWHELGILILTILLRQRGWGVKYLGPNLSLERFSEVLGRIRPQMVLLSAATPDTAERLDDLVGVLEVLPEPKPLIGLGGLAFLMDPTLANRIPGTIFGPGAEVAVAQIEQLMDHIQIPDNL